MYTDDEILHRERERQKGRGKGRDHVEEYWGTEQLGNPPWTLQPKPAAN